MHSITKEETLDPEDWKEMRKLGHKMLDEMIDLHQNIRDYRLKFPTKESIDNIQLPLTVEGEGVEKVYHILNQNILWTPE